MSLRRRGGGGGGDGDSDAGDWNIKEAEEGDWHAGPARAQSWMPTRLVMWLLAGVLIITLMFSVADVTRAKALQVERQRDVARYELAQSCCQMWASRVIPPKEAAACAAILGEEKRVNGHNRCELAKDIQSRVFALEVAKAVWHYYVPLGGLSVGDIVARFGFDALSVYLGKMALRSFIPI